MDPALWEVIESVEPEAEVHALVRLRPGAPPPPAVRIVARFGTVATCRLRCADIHAVRRHPSVASLKASQRFRGDWAPASASPGGAVASAPGGARTGRGVVVGLVDWGLDVAHDAFRTPDGGTRLLGLWDQRRRPGTPPPAYGYGRVFTRADIDRALDTDAPYDALGYHPGDVDPAAVGTHGTHVLDIAAGTRRDGEAGGVAPGADLVFVHLADQGVPQDGLASSVSLLEAIDFIRGVAGSQPCVVNLSLGRHGGPHDGSTLVERALEAFACSAPGRVVVQSAGNYHAAHTHTDGQVGTRPARFDFVVEAGDETDNELDLWYPGADQLTFALYAPGGELAVSLELGERGVVVADGRPVGRAYHRRSDPNNGDHNVRVFLWAVPATFGRWQVELAPVRVEVGTFDAWVERDSRGGQARIVPEHATPRHTTGTICHAPHAITVGAYDGTAPGRPAAVFASEGPTRDGRTKPELAAPGVSVVAACSAPPGAARPTNGLTTKSGTSMAAPRVTGTVALLLEACPTLGVREVRAALLRTVDGPPRRRDRPQLGAGYLNTGHALARVDERCPSTSLERRMTVSSTLESIAAGGRPLEELLSPGAGTLAEWFDRARSGGLERALVVAAPGASLGCALQPGDLVVQRVLGEGRLARGFEVVAGPQRRLLLRGLGGPHTTELSLFDGPTLRPDFAVLRLHRAGGPSPSERDVARLLERIAAGDIGPDEARRAADALRGGEAVAAESQASSSEGLEDADFGRFTDHATIDALFRREVGTDFISWFNAHVGGREHWRPRRISTEAGVAERFAAIWNHIPTVFDSESINFTQFVALTSIFINENPRFDTRSERGPSLSYFYERRQIRTDPPRFKASYNTLRANRTAYACFTNDDFCDAHRHRAAAALARTSDRRWRGPVYPRGEGWTDAIDPAANGFIMEADFFKFRGRGFNQITLRGNYKPLIEVVLRYAGTSEKVQRCKQRWSSAVGEAAINDALLERVAFRSSNEDWDDLFFHDDLEFPLLALKVYYQRRARRRGEPNPLQIPDGSITSPAVASAVRGVGRATGGGDYEQRVYDRVRQIIATFNRTRAG